MRPSTFLLRPGATAFHSATTASTFLLLLLSRAIHASTIESPPSLATCRPVAIPYSGAPAGDVFVSVIRGGDPTSPALVDLGTHEGPSGSVTWLVNLPAGTSITLKLLDSSGVTAFSAPITIQASPDISCLGQTSIIGGTSGGGSTSLALPSTISDDDVPTETTRAPDSASGITSSSPTRAAPNATTSKAPATTSSSVKDGAAYRSYAVSATTILVGFVGTCVLALS